MWDAAGVEGAPAFCHTAAFVVCQSRGQHTHTHTQQTPHTTHNTHTHSTQHTPFHTDNMWIFSTWALKALSWNTATEAEAAQRPNWGDALHLPFMTVEMSKEQQQHAKQTDRQRDRQRQHLQVLSVFLCRTLWRRRRHVRAAVFDLPRMRFIAPKRGWRWPPQKPHTHIQTHTPVQRLFLSSYSYSC